MLNEERSAAALAERLVAMAPSFVVLEATVSYELTAVTVLAARSLPVVVVNPRQSSVAGNIPLSEASGATSPTSSGQLRPTDTELHELVQASPLWREREEDLLRSMAGVGQVLALALPSIEHALGWPGSSRAAANCGHQKCTWEQ